MSFSLIHQTFADIAANLLVTQTINRQVFGNISNFFRSLSLFFLNFYIFRMFPLLIRKCKNFEKTLLLFGYSVPHFLGNFKGM